MPLFVFMLNLAAVEMKNSLLLLMWPIMLCVDNILTSQKITCRRGPGYHVAPPAAEPHCGTNREMAGRQHIPDPAHPGKRQTSSVEYKQ